MHSLTERYRPRTADEFVGERNRKGLAKLEECIKEKKPCLVHGKPGVGKTTAVYITARRLEFTVVETNASDERKKDEMQDLLRRVKMKSFRKVLYLFDEVDGIKEGYVILSKIIKSSKHPVVMVANELWKLPSELTEGCEKIKFYPPQLQEVVTKVKYIAEREKLRVKYDQITSDVRSSINAVTSGGELYRTESRFETVKKIFAGEKVRADMSILPWLVDNAPKFYHGRKLFEAYELLSLIGMTGRLELLSCFEGSKGDVSYPFYLRRAEALKRGKK